MGGVDPAIVTSGVLAFAAIISSGTPLIMARRRKTQDTLEAAKREVQSAEEYSAKRGDLTLASWVALNGGLRAEVDRLQAVADRQQAVLDRQQARVSQLEAEIVVLNASIRAMHA